LTHIRWTPKSVSDLKAISSYIEQQRNLATANKVCRIIYDAVQVLRQFPEIGKASMEEGTREYVVPALPSHIVVYRIVQPEAVQIVRIWHGAQQRQE
jgi:addiction module RelE/StbE family toxin